MILSVKGLPMVVPSAPIDPIASDPATPEAVAAFVKRWSESALSERSNCAPFILELCDLLGLPKPAPATADHTANAYVFEGAIPLHDERTGQSTTGFIDLYKRGCFILEAKQYDAAAPAEAPPAFAAARERQRKSGVRRDTAAWDRKMIEARSQAERYLRHLPADEPTPIFLLVVDVGHSIELFADFSQKGRAPLHFPDPRTYRIRLENLIRPEVRQLLRTVWTDPASLDPAKRSAAVTREVAAHLAELARLFERRHEPALVAAFLSRCLFCMFAEDIGLLPRASFSKLLDSVRDDPGAAVPLLQVLFEEMNKGGYSVILRQTLLHFNGGLFAESTALPLDSAQLELLRRAAACEWRQVEPAIFGTLLERALDPAERHKLGAHYTPRAYVERLVLPTVIEPLREDWTHVRAAAVTLATRGDLKGAIKEARTFHHQLCQVRVLDPACGSGNFLYVTLEHLKRLEGEVLELIESFGEIMHLGIAGETVDPHQFLGLEINPRAATVAELVLWIGYLQWHHRNRGDTEWPEPVLHAFKNIECRDAVLEYDDKTFAKDDNGQLRTVWDRRTFKTDPATGRKVPDDSAVVPIEQFVNPRPATWPQADFIVGNPPFLGTSRMREELGDSYTETLRAAYPEVPESADFVMYWWYKAAEECIGGRARRFGFITTNSIRQTFNRRVVQWALDRGVYLTFAIPDHPWIDAAQCAAVRIAMTVGAPPAEPMAEGAAQTERTAGELQRVRTETPDEATGENEVDLMSNLGPIAADLTIGVDVAGMKPLSANAGLSSPGVKLHGSGFIVAPEQAIGLGLGSVPGLEAHIRPYRNGRDLADRPRGVMVIDLFGLTADQVRQRFPRVYDHVLKSVKPERDSKAHSKDGAAYARLWWLHGKPRSELRPALRGLSRYVATGETGKHRHFQFLASDVLPDNMLIAIASDDAFHLGVLSSRIHVVYALAAGGRLGVGNDPRYNKTRCFDPFPFPDCPEAQKAKIRDLAEALDTHRKRAQAEHGLGLTDIYNVLEKLRSGEELTAKDRKVHENAMVATLRQLHDHLDRAVADAYDWPWPLDDADILARVVALNAQRAAEEERGLIRWLRPDYQQALAGGRRPGTRQATLDLPDDQKIPPPTASKRPKAKKAAWPSTLAERIKAVDVVLAAAATPLSAAELAKMFTRAKADDIAEILGAMAALGRARRSDDGERWFQ